MLSCIIRLLFNAIIIYISMKNYKFTLSLPNNFIFIIAKLF